MAARVFYVGTDDEVSHHAQPLENEFDIQLVTPERVGAIAGPDDLAIFFSEHFRRFRSAILELKEKRCRTLYAVDGILEWRNAFENRVDEPACPLDYAPVLCDKVAAIGRSQARMLDFWGNKGKVELVGLPRLDSMIQSSPEPPGLNANPTKNNRSVRPRILVMTAKWPAFTEAQQVQLEASLRCLKHWFDEHPEVEVVWRLTGNLDQLLDLTNSFVQCSQKELISQLDECDALITTPSTAMLEGMLLNKPTAILEFNDCPQFNSVAWQIRHADQLESVIGELLAPSAYKMAQQEFALHDTLECQTAALPRLSELVNQMLRYPMGEAPGNLVPVETENRVSALGHEFLFNNHRLAESNDQQELKAQVAFLEREYEILKARNDLIESEFEKAKSTIDHVFNNPVVFPFIKAGELAGRIFNRQQPQGSSE